MIVSQTDFVSALLGPEADVPEGLVDPSGVTTTKRFNVYRNNVAVSLTEALETAFPAIAKLIGEENFKRVAGVFLRQHPPTSPLMMFYGAEMPAFLENFPPLQHLGYLPDVARFEQAMRHAYHAADAAPIDAARLQDLSPDQLMAAKMEIAPAVQVVVSDWPVYSVWAYNMIEGSPKPEARKEAVLITRPEFDPTGQVISPGGASMIKALQAGQPLGQALEAAASDPDFDFTTTLGQLLSGAAITDLRTDP